MTEVTKEEFYKRIGPLDVIFDSVGRYPYETVFRMRHNKSLVGKITQTEGNSRVLPTRHYYIVNALQKQGKY